MPVTAMRGTEGPGNTSRTQARVYHWLFEDVSWIIKIDETALADPAIADSSQQNEQRADTPDLHISSTRPRLAETFIVTRWPLRNTRRRIGVDRGHAGKYRYDRPTVERTIANRVCRFWTWLSLACGRRFSDA